MAKQKFKKMLVQKEKEKLAFKESQEQLKKKHDIHDDVVVVEKSNMIKFTVRSLVGLVRLLVSFVFLTLAFVGLMALVYPEPRQDILVIAKEVIQQLQSYMH